MFLHTNSPTAVDMVAESARAEATAELLRLGYLSRPWGRVVLGFGPHSKRLDIRQLFVEPIFRRQGIGSSLLDAIKDRAEELGWSVQARTVVATTTHWWSSRGFSLDPQSPFSDWYWRPHLDVQ